MRGCFYRLYDITRNKLTISKMNLLVYFLRNWLALKKLCSLQHGLFLSCLIAGRLVVMENGRGKWEDTRLTWRMS